MSTPSFVKTAIPLFLVIIIDSMGIGLFFPVLSPLFMSNDGILGAHADLASRDTMYAVILGIFTLCMFISAPILGDLSDRIGRKNVLLLCLIGTAISSLLSAVGVEFANIPLLIFSRAFAGFVAGSQSIAQAAIIDVSDPKNKILNLSFIGLAGSLGFALGPIVGGFLSDKSVLPWFTYATPFYADALLALFNGILLLFTFTETLAERKAFTFSVKAQFKLFTDAFKHKEIRLLSIIILFYEIAWSLYFQYIAIYLVQQYQFTSKHIGLFMSMIGVVFGVTLLLIIRIILLLVSVKSMTRISLLIAAFAIFLPVIFTDVAAQWYIAIPITITVGLAYSGLLTLSSNTVSEDKQGWIMGVVTAVVSAAWIISSILTGLLNYLGIFLPFIAAAICMLVSWLYLQFA